MEARSVGLVARAFSLRCWWRVDSGLQPVSVRVSLVGWKHVSIVQIYVARLHGIDSARCLQYDIQCILCPRIELVGEFARELFLHAMFHLR